VLRADDAFHARVVAARLGADGIPTQFRGGIDTPYPGGTVEVLVSEADLETAKELLLADEVEAAFLEPDSGGERSGARFGPWVLAAMLVGLALFAYVHTIGYAR
jgi:hypothetical protein